MVDHYSVLGLPPFSSTEEVKRRYRELARKLHPDVNQASDAQDHFVNLNDSYEVLSDPELKKSFDLQLRLQQQLQERAEQFVREQESGQKTTGGSSQQNSQEPSEKEQYFSYRDQEKRLIRLMNLGQYAQAQTVAESVIRRDPKNAAGHAALGDIARIRGDFSEAANCYAYAAQFDARNSVYQGKYEEILDLLKNQKVQLARNPGERGGGAILIGGFVVCLCVLYTALSPENPLLPELSPISTWTLGQWTMFGLAGITLGASLSSADLLDTLDSGSSPALARIHPSFLLMMVSVVSFWVALALYVLVGGTQKAFNTSLSRLLGSVMVVVVLFSLARLFYSTGAALQTLLWAGNVVCIGATLGWSAADGVRRLRLQ